MARTKTALQESVDTRTGGLWGFVLGAVFGGLLIGMLAIGLEIAGIAHGGVVLSMLGGAALGGLAGLMWGALAARRTMGPPARG